MSKEDCPLMQLRPQEQQRILKLSAQVVLAKCYIKSKGNEKTQLFIPEVNPESCVEGPSCQAPWCKCESQCATVRVWRSEDSLQWSILCFCHVGLRIKNNSPSLATSVFD